MTQYVFANNVNTTLAAAATSTDTTLTLGSSNNLPSLTTGQIMPLWLNDAATRSVYELVYVTGISGATLTVERGQEGTTAVSWAVGDFAYCGPTGGTVANVYGDSLNTFEVADSTSGTQQSVPRSQADSTYLTQANAAADYAAINGSSSESFDVGIATSSTNALRQSQSLNAGSLSDETANRVAGTTYTNTTGRPIYVIVMGVTSATNAAAYMPINIAGTAVGQIHIYSASGTGYFSGGFIVPTGATYEISSVNNCTISSWFEIR